jgi:hypothetical protein
MKAARVLQTRQLRDRRQLVEVSCPCCGDSHWVLNPAPAVECLSQPGKFMSIDGGGHG